MPRILSYPVNPGRPTPRPYLNYKRTSGDCISEDDLYKKMRSQRVDLVLEMIQNPNVFLLKARTLLEWYSSIHGIKSF